MRLLALKKGYVISINYSWVIVLDNLVKEENTYLRPRSHRAGANRAL